MASNGSTCLSGSTPVRLREDNVCNLGFFCPNNTAQNPPEYCPPTTDCQITRLEITGNVCKQPQGTYEPIVCRPGFYCPQGGTQELLCPQGHYCPLAAYEPVPCDRISACPAGSTRQFTLNGLVSLCLIDFVVIFILLGRTAQRIWHTRYKRISNALWSNSTKDGSQTEKVIIQPNEEPELPLSSICLFVNSVAKCLKSNELGLEIKFSNIGYHVQYKGTRRPILQNVSGQIKKGSMLAIMGASGSGKSTLVRVLMGKLKHNAGNIEVNGRHRPISDFKSHIGYVPQDDVVMAEMTVRENLLHSARVRLPAQWKDHEIQEHVDILLSCLQLDLIQDSLVGDTVKPIISGGQRKRVSIGMELAAAPSLLVLDEPTSGLDATSALSIIQLLKSLCKLGIAVVCIIHQPRVEIFSILDDLLILAEGQEIFLGKTQESVDFFRSLGYDFPANHNPADIIMDIASGNGSTYLEGDDSSPHSDVSHIITAWNQREQATIKRNSASPLESDTAIRKSIDFHHQVRGNGASWFYQVYLCFLRSMIQQSRTLTGFLLEISVGGIAGLLIGLSVYRLEGILFQGIYHAPFQLFSSAFNYTLVPELGLLCSLAIGLAAAAPGVKIFGEEKVMYWREASSGHSRSAYFIGKTLSTFFRLGLSALHFTVFYVILATPRIPFGILYIANLLYFYCIYGLAACVSTITRRENGPLMAMIVSLIIGIFGGYGPPLSTVISWHLEWLWRICPGTWLSEAYFEAHTEPLRYLYDIEAAARWTGYKTHQLSLDIGMLFIIGSVYRILAFVGLVGLNRDKQA